MTSIRRESARRVVAAVSLPLLAVILSALAYQLLVVPWVESGNRVNQLVWLLIWGPIPLGLIVAGALVEKISSALMIAAIVTVFRRVGAGVLAFFHAPGLLKLDIYEADYWTIMFAVELCVWLPAAAIGWGLGLSIRRERRVRGDSAQV